MTLRNCLQASFILCGVSLCPSNAQGAVTWSQPMALTAADCTQPNVALNAEGDCVVVWTKLEGFNSVIQAASRPFGEAWKEVQPVSPAEGRAQIPLVANDNFGTATVVWQGLNGNVLLAEGRSYTHQGGWESSVQLSSGDAEAIDISSAGTPDNVIAVWQSYAGGTLKIQAASSFAEGSWAEAVDISTAPLALFAKVAVNSGGDSVAIWSELSGSSFGVSTADSSTGEAWTVSTSVSAPGITAYASDVAIDNYGDILAVWTAFNGTQYSVQVAEGIYGQSWNAPLTLSASGKNSLSPLVAMNGSGDAFVLWATFNASNISLTSVKKPRGGSWSTPVELPIGEGNVGAFHIVLDSSSNATAIWELSANQSSAIYTSSSALNGNWSDSTQLSTHDAAASSPVDAYGYAPQLAVDGRGSVTAVWLEGNGISGVVTTATSTPVN